MTTVRDTGSKLRIHVTEQPGFPIAWRLTPEGFFGAAEKYPQLKHKFTVTFGDHMFGGDADLATAEVVFASEFNVTNLAKRAPKLKWVQSTSSGIERLLPGMPPGVVLTNNSGIHPDKGGEYVMTCILMLNHRVPYYVTRQREKRWDPAFAKVIKGKTVVIVGTGAIGESVAKLAKGFELNVLGVSRSGKPKEFFDQVFSVATMRQALLGADFVVLCTPLTNETKGLFGRGELDLLPHHAGVINVGRGPVLDNDALLDKLKKNELSGAILDVFPEEPVPEQAEFWDTPNLIMSPHCGVDDASAFLEHCYERFFSNLELYLAGKELEYVVDHKLGY